MVVARERRPGHRGPRDRPGGALDQALALGDPAKERRLVGVRCAGHPGNDVGRLGRPAATGRERGGEGQAGTGVAGVADRLRHVPVGLATGQPQDGLRDGLDVVGERDGQRRRAA